MQQNPFDNPEFRAEFKSVLDDSLSDISRLVAEHEKALQRSKGAIAVMGLIWAGFLGLLEYLFHRS